ncbi:unnamed protein product [Pedinophyceae sp. YPF-701]|nr:unnamed protein product [Pedinophyceae sp. YPF-701]
MRAETLQVMWHAQKPVNSVDFHPSGMLATSGEDDTIRLWHVDAGDADASPTVTYLSSITNPTGGVNVVRFSPSGEMLASGGSAGELIVFKAAPGQRAAVDQSDEGFPEFYWKMTSSLKAGQADISDLSWSPDNSALLTGSVDSKATVWDVARNRLVNTLQDHRHWIQGVCWDPLGQYLVTQGVDAAVRCYRVKQAGAKGAADDAAKASNLTLAYSLRSRAFPGKDAAAAEGGGDAGTSAAKPQEASHRLFHDERGAATMFRRLAWAPDGSFLVTPSGLFKAHPEDDARNASYLFPRGALSKPAAVLHGTAQPSVAVRFCPVVFRAAPGDGEAAADLPYRLVYAVASSDSVALYHTDAAQPFALAGALHPFASISDLAWDRDGSRLAVSSRDGFVSLITFAPGELGEPLPRSELEQAGLPAALLSVLYPEYPPEMLKLEVPKTAAAPVSPAEDEPKPAAKSVLGGARYVGPTAHAHTHAGGAGPSTGGQRARITPVPVGGPAAAPQQLIDLTKEAGGAGAPAAGAQGKRRLVPIAIDVAASPAAPAATPPKADGEPPKKRRLTPEKVPESAPGGVPAQTPPAGSAQGTPAQAGQGFAAAAVRAAAAAARAAEAQQ